MSTEVFDLTISTAVQKLMGCVCIVGVRLVKFIVQMQTISFANIPSTIERLKLLATKWCEQLDEFAFEYRRALLLDEEAVAASGGRDYLGEETVISEKAMPLSASLQMGRAHALFLLALLSQHEIVLEYLSEQGDSIAPDRMTGANIFTSAMARLDTKIDQDMCNLQWEALTSCRLVQDCPTVRAQGLRTCSDIIDMMNGMRKTWKTLDGETAPVEGLCRVLTLAAGRLSARTLSQTAKIIERTNPYPPTVSPLNVKLYKTAALQLSSNFFADMWICLDSMQTYRRTVLHALTVQTDCELHRIWKAAVDTADSVPGMAITDPTDVVRLLTKPLLLEWARNIAESIANEDKIMIAVKKVAQTNTLMIGDRLLHAAYRPNDDRSADAVLVWRDNSRFADATLGDSPKKVLADDRDPDTHAGAGECLMQLIDYMNQNYGGEKSINEQCLYREDSTEKLDLHATSFVIPVILEIHRQYVVTIEGRRTPLGPFTLALRTWIRMCLREEQKGTSMFRISPVVRLMTTWWEREQELAALATGSAVEAMES